jgi:hypothetical protein
VSLRREQITQFRDELDAGKLRAVFGFGNLHARRLTREFQCLRTGLGAPFRARLGISS